MITEQKTEKPDLDNMSTSEALKQLGYTHKPGTIHGKREIFDTEGRSLGNFTCFEANDYLRARGLVK